MGFGRQGIHLFTFYLIRSSSHKVNKIISKIAAVERI